MSLHQPVAVNQELARQVQHALKEKQNEGSAFGDFQQWLRDMVQNTQLGFYIDTTQTILSLLACIMYVVSTYFEEMGPLPIWIEAWEWVLFIAFSADYLLHLVTAENIVSFVVSRGAIIDFLSILPIVTVSSQASIGFLRVLRVFRIVRILRGARTFASGGSVDEDESVNRQLGLLVFILLSFIFMGAGFFHSVELMVGGTFQWPASDLCDWDRLA